MASFVASEKVEALTYDFSPHGPAGEIPEPSSKQIEKYRTVLRDNFEVVSDVVGKKREDLSSEDILKLYASTPAQEKAMVTATADLTGIAPTTLNALPYRLREAFVGWIMGQFFSPEA